MTLFKTSFASAVAVLMVGAAAAHEYQAGAVEIDHPWARPTVAATQPAAAFFILKNDGDADDRLIEARVAPDFAEGVELHTTLIDGAVARMRHLTDGAAVPAGGKVAFEPGGKHVMLFGLAAPLSEGESFPMTLVFENAGEVEVEVVIEDPADGAATDHSHH
ncbi:MAG: copper chaperone PCu(A)C [Pseudomonadota bacterium]